MWRWLGRWLSALLVAGALLLPAGAQGPGGAPPADKPAERSMPAFAHTVALVTMLLVLVILCMPTRKR